MDEEKKMEEGVENGLKEEVEDEDAKDKEDGELNQIRRLVNTNKLKLWLPPFYVDGKADETKLWEVSQQIAPAMDLQLEVVVEGIRCLQERALEKLKAKEILDVAGTIRLKLKLAKSLQNSAGAFNKQQPPPNSIEVKKEALGSTLAERIGALIGCEGSSLRLISAGKVVKEDVLLLEQNIRPGASVMVVKIDTDSESLKVLAETRKVLSDTREDASILGEGEEDGMGLTIADQSGKSLDLPQAERKALIIAMSLHEKGRAALKRREFDLALVLLLEADQEYESVRSALLQNVDNYGLLNLDIAWCYVQLGNISGLDDAVARLGKCEAIFAKSHGQNMERLVAVKGSAGSEKALYLRMHLLQGIAFYHSGEPSRAKLMLRQAGKEFKEIDIPSEAVDEVVALGFSRKEARIALRMNSGNVAQATQFAQEKRKETERIEKEEAERRKKWKAYGKTAGGKLVNLGYMKTLQNMGFSEDYAMMALKQTDNDINASIDLIQNNPDLLFAAIESVFAEEETKEDKKKEEKKVEEEKKEEVEKKDEEVEEEEEAGPAGEKRQKKDVVVNNDDKKRKKEKENALQRMKDDIGGAFGETDDYLDIELDEDRKLLEKYRRILHLDE